MTDPTLDQQPPPEGGRKHDAQRYAAFAAAGLAVLFALFNLDEVKVNWIVGSTRSPLIFVIALSFVLGGGAGYFIARRRGKPDA